MKRIICTILLSCFALFIFAQQGETKKEELPWFTDAMKAYEASKASGKPIFALFTGSDWCVWCHKLDRDVLYKKAFIEWAKKNVTLLMLDFPRRTQQTPELMQQNQGLQQTFGVQGYPTIWIFDLTKEESTNKFNINARGSLGYPAGAEAGNEEIKFLEDAKKIINTNKPK